MHRTRKRGCYLGAAIDADPDLAVGIVVSGRIEIPGVGHRGRWQSCFSEIEAIRASHLEIDLVNTIIISQLVVANVRGMVLSELANEGVIVRLVGDLCPGRETEAIGPIFH